MTKRHHYYFATVVHMNKNGLRGNPIPYTIKAANALEADEKLREYLGDARYEIRMTTAIGYHDEE